jgi:hypothetical protein
MGTTGADESGVAAMRRRLVHAIVPAMSSRRAIRTLATLGAVAAALVCAGVGTAAVRDDVAVSSNWAGYAVTGSSSAPTSFSSVSAIWKQPKATCTIGSATYSAFWVGLGGFSETSRALEQIGTSADCTAAGKAMHYMWYELVPAPSAPIKLKVFPGNVIAALVSVAGTKVTLQIRNLTRKTKFTKVVRMSAPDLSSAEWVAEAPSACTASGSCTVLPLTNFGTVPFAQASATANGHTGPISDAAWSATTIQLVADANATGEPAPAGAVPSALSPDGTVFTVTMQSPNSAPR